MQTRPTVRWTVEDRLLTETVMRVFSSQLYLANFELKMSQYQLESENLLG